MTKLKLVLVSKQRLPTGEWHGEWVIDGYEAHAVHGWSAATLEDLLEHKPKAREALLTVLQERFPDLEGG